MSAFIVSKAHIDVLVDYANRMEYKPPIVEQYLMRLGQALVNQNNVSVNYRYPDNVAQPYIYHTAPPKRAYTPVEIIKACDCYDYQACEAPEYEKTVAYHIVQAIRMDAIIKAVLTVSVDELPGYEQAAWGID